MGLLVEGQPIPAEDLREWSKFIREHGVLQFLSTWKRLKHLQNDELKFGDEIEVGLMVVDDQKKTVKICLRGEEIRNELIKLEQLYSHDAEGVSWQPEYGAWMIESTPSRPYTGYASDLLRVERNMILRRRRLLAVLRDGEIAPTVTCFPLLGVQDFIHDMPAWDTPHSSSNYVPDCIINIHPRFAALTRNIRFRRGEKVDIRVPLFEDSFTPEYRDLASEGASRPSIDMDAMAFGMGMCCLQVTFQACDVDESRYMYDQLAVLAPIMMAMTAGTPFYRGRISDIDARWTVISQAVDDRNRAERGLIAPDELSAVRDDRLAGGGVRSIPKSRYDSISTFIYHCNGDSECERTFAQYNDIDCPIDEEVKQLLRTEGVDENLAHHVAHLFIRDPLVAYHGRLELNDEVNKDHFESIQSTNWQTCRWKPPPSASSIDAPHIGWRTEFRSMEVQLTDFENAAFTVFIILLTRVLLAFDLGLYVPLSLVDENMRRAHQRDAVRTQRFYFRKHIAPPEVDLNPGNGTKTGCKVCNESISEETRAIGSNHSVEGDISAIDNGSNVDGAMTGGSSKVSGNIAYFRSAFGCATCCQVSLNPEDAFEEMTMTEIFMGKADYFPGLLPLVYAYLDYTNCDSTTYNRVSQYLKFIELRATGNLLTPATWMRNFVTQHAKYKNDSVISQEIAYDLMKTCQGIGDGSIACPALLGDVIIDRVRKQDAYNKPLAGRLTSQERCALLNALMQRGNAVRPPHIARGKSRNLDSPAHNRPTAYDHR